MKGQKIISKWYLTIGIVSMLIAVGTNPKMVSKGFAKGINQSKIFSQYEVKTVGKLEDKTISKKIDKSIRMILDKGTTKFFGNYPVDENFLCWFTSNYGEDHINKLVKYLRKDRKKNPNFWYKLSGRSIHVLWLEYCEDIKFQTYRLDNVKWIEDKNGDGITTLDFIGDINFDPKWHTMKAVRKSYGKMDEFISEGIKERLKNADITMVNNEFTYGSGGKAVEGKDYCFKATEESAENLEIFGTDIVSLANNHVYDYGKKGLISTIKTLEKNEVTYIGAGRNLDEAKKIQYYIINGKKYAYVSATQIEKYSNFTKAATDNSPGVLKMLDPREFIKVIEEADKNSDYVIAYVHWGSEGNLHPDNDVRLLAKRFKNAGADVIIGGHSHRLQGIEYVGKTPVFYSLGNFWFSSGALYTTVAELTIAKDGKLQPSILPCVQKHMRTTELIDENDRRDYFEYIADISKGIAIDDGGKLYKFDKAKANSLDSGDITYGSMEKDNTNERYSFFSGMNYSSHYGGIDLEGKLIDVVGNLK